MDRTDFPLFVLYFSPSFPFSPINSSHSLSLSLCSNRGISLYLWRVDCIAVQQRVAPCSYFNYVNSWLRIVVLEQLCRARCREHTPVTDSSRTCLWSLLTLSLIISDRFFHPRESDPFVRGMRAFSLGISSID